MSKRVSDEEYDLVYCPKCYCMVNVETNSIQTVRDLRKQHAELVEAVREVATKIDDILFDTDPYIPEHWSEQDIKDEEPLYWCHVKLITHLPNELVNDSEKPLPPKDGER